LAGALAERLTFAPGAAAGLQRLIGPDVNFGRELLLATARATGFMAGCSATNLRGVADELAFTRLAAEGLRVADDVQLADLVTRAVAANSRARGTSDVFRRLASSPGFLRACRDSILEARMAGLSAADVGRVAGGRTTATDLASVMHEYERLVVSERLADPARVFELALEAFDAEADFVLRGGTLLVAGLSLRGLPGRLIARLRERGADTLVREAPHPLAAPACLLAASPPATPVSSLASAVGAAFGGQSLDADPGLVVCDVFAAATPADELREVCRRVLAEGLRWDDVEVVTLDPDEYGVALDALGQQLGIGVTMLRGIPLARTRLGRALERWVTWLENGLPADVLREALEAGDLFLPGTEVTPAALARELRLLNIGWGRGRYEYAVQALRDGRPVAAMRPAEDETDEDFGTRRDVRAATCLHLATLLERLLALAPPVPARGSEEPVAGSAHLLAAATLAFLELVPTHGAAEEQTMERLCGRLQQLAAIEGEPTSFNQALGAVRALVGDQRAWPLETADRKPWSSSGGFLHLTDVAHAGITGRRRTFVVGLDADRTAGPAREDPLLNDSVRRDLAASGLPTTSERREEWEYALAVALAGLRGRVTLSYATSATLDGREASPSAILLSVLRIAAGDATLSYADFRARVFPPASAVPPVAEETHLDARDVWLSALTDGPLLLDGSDVVAASFPMLAAGLRARDAARSAAIGAYHGLVPHAGSSLDPTRAGARSVSASALEAQSACALRWFYHYGLGIVPPSDPEYNPDAWLDQLQRGALLHEVFEGFTRRYSGRQDARASSEARTDVLAEAEAALARFRDELPPPSEAVFEVEAMEIRRAALAFLEMERARWEYGDRGLWAEFELEFGWRNPAIAYALRDDTSLHIRGRVDRVDALPDGTLRVVDYKTGKAHGYGNNPKAGPFNGGRRLQAALYVPAVAATLGREVSRFEYRFPTERGQNEVIGYEADTLEAARGIVSDLVEQVRRGEFVPTNDASDCAYCDYVQVCRVSRDGWNTVSPRAGWAKEFGAATQEYVAIVSRRGAAGADEPGDDE